VPCELQHSRHWVAEASAAALAKTNNNPACQYKLQSSTHWRNQQAKQSIQMITCLTGILQTQQQGRQAGRHLVSLESRYGTCPCPSTRAVMTRPRVSRLLLMLPASLARCSTAPDLRQ
jgi:hypothetical protein